MKLRTEMQDGCVHALGYCVDTEDVKPIEVAKLEHDAAAAHALMLAVNHVDSPYQGLTHQAQWILRRADELMAEWGFDREKVES